MFVVGTNLCFGVLVFWVGVKRSEPIMMRQHKYVFAVLCPPCMMEGVSPMNDEKAWAVSQKMASKEPDTCP